MKAGLAALGALAFAVPAAAQEAAENVPGLEFVF